jgi:uncharacterized protein (DUF1697 family)
MRWVALLRGVNLGARNKVPMAKLRELLDEAGYENVRTFIASGNVLLDAPPGAAKLAAALERLVGEELGVTTTVILRKPRELAGTVAAHPFGPDTSKTHVAFLAGRPAEAAADRLAAVDGGADRAVLVGSDVYLRLSDGVHGTRLSITRVESLLGVSATVRNWRTVAALAHLAAEA